MVIDMDEAKLRTIAQLQEFLDATQEVIFAGTLAHSDAQRYEHISRVLKRFDYLARSKLDRGVVLSYLRRTSGYSRAQLTRLVGRWQANRLASTPLAKRYGRPAKPFARKYTAGDIELLVAMDRANEDVCGPAIVHLLQRAFVVYGDPSYERLSKLSVSHLYNLRKSGGYRALRSHFTKTRTVCNPIGVRKAPRPNGRAGWVRIDSVHQGDLDGIKGVYHITCVDAVSQWHASGHRRALWRHHRVNLAGARPPGGPGLGSGCGVAVEPGARWLSHPCLVRRSGLGHPHLADRTV